jgi:ankyrin repeat protein
MARRSRIWSAFLCLIASLLYATPALAAPPDDAGLVDAAAHGDTTRITRLLASGGSVNAVVPGRDGFDLTPVAAAVLHDHLPAVKLLVAHGADLESHSYAGQTPLLLAARYDHREIAEFLIARHADLNARPADGLTPLMYAALNGDMALVKLLVKVHADMSVMTSYDETAARLAKASGHMDIMKFLKSAGEKK